MEITIIAGGSVNLFAGAKWGRPVAPSLYKAFNNLFILSPHIYYTVLTYLFFGRLHTFWNLTLSFEKLTNSSDLLCNSRHLHLSHWHAERKKMVLQYNQRQTRRFITMYYHFIELCTFFKRIIRPNKDKFKWKIYGNSESKYWICWPVMNKLVDIFFYFNP